MIAEVEAYVMMRDSALRAIYQLVQTLLLSLPDTLEDNFQIASDLNRVFTKYAAERHIEQPVFVPRTDADPVAQEKMAKAVLESMFTPDDLRPTLIRSPEFLAQQNRQLIRNREGMPLERQCHLAELDIRRLLKNRDGIVRDCGLEHYTWHLQCALEAAEHVLAKL